MSIVLAVGGVELIPALGFNVTGIDLVHRSWLFPLFSVWKVHSGKSAWS